MPRTFWTLAAILVGNALALAQTSPQLGRVRVGSVTIRSGPGDQMPACGTLEQGSIVIVDHPEGAEWVAIQPPPGSLSWINHLYVEVRKPENAQAGQLKFPCDAVINTEGEVKIAAGIMGEGKPLNVQRTKLPEGTIVRIVGPKVRVQSDDTETYWYPITPPRSDFRFIPKNSVDLIAGEKTGFVVHASKPGEGSNKPGDNGTGLVAIPNPDLPRPGVSTNLNIGGGSGTWAGSGGSGTEPTHTLWKQARQAERDGNYDLAERLYKQLADQETKPEGDTRLVNMCYLRIQQIREWRHKKTTPEPQPTDPKTQPGRGLALNSEGILRATTVKIAGQKGYALTSQRGEVWIYVIADGIELDRYIGRWVDLKGTVTYPSNLGGIGLLSATQVESVK